jgi:uncharacterized protein YndB with AHSA1/START domain
MSSSTPATGNPRAGIPHAGTHASGAPTSPAPGDQGRLLATAVSWNAVFSGTSGVTLLAGGALLAGPLGVHGGLLALVGVGLVGFAVTLVWLLAVPRRLRPGARWVIGADLAWIAGAAALLSAWPDVLTATGRGALGAATAVVAVLAVAQAVGLRRHGPGPTTGVSPVSLGVERTLSAPADRVWDAVADAGGYARFAPGIAATAIIAGSGDGMVRTCTDDHGGAWSETCTLWEEGHRYRMTVDVSSYPAYYRMLLHQFAQTWTVTPTDDGTRLTLSFDGAVKLGVVGRLAARILGRRRRLEAILDGYEDELAACQPAG